LSLGVVEIGRHCDDGVLDWLGQVGFGRFLHLDEDHGGNFFSEKFLGFAFEFDLDLRLAVVAFDDLKWP
jgi:hypothetical protein